MPVQEEAGSRRVDLLYLADSLLQNCRNPKNSGCGPDTAPGQVSLETRLCTLNKCMSQGE